jgi:hypothetical protein
MEPTESPIAKEEVIECRVTPWYFKRMGMLAAMLIVFAGLFFYDGIWGYAAKNEKAAMKERFEEEVLKGYDRAKSENTLDAWRAEMIEKRWPVDINGQPPKWMSYAAEHGIDEKPKRYSDKEIAEQFWWGGTMGLGSLIVGVLVFLNRSKMLKGYAEHWVTPEGKEVLYTDVFRVDKRKWDNKGLAYAFHRGADGVKEVREVIDDLKFAGADRVLERLLARFRGELIEKVMEPEEVAEPAVDSSD